MSHDREDSAESPAGGEMLARNARRNTWRNEWYYEPSQSQREVNCPPWLLTPHASRLRLEMLRRQEAPG